MAAFAGAFTLTPIEKVISGPGTISALAGELARLRRRHALVVTGRTLGGSPLLVTVTAQIGARLAGVFSGARQHVPASSVCELAAAIRDTGADCLVSFGGGSPIDTVKAAIHMALSDADGGATGENDALVHIAVPTTLSAGEFTSVAGVTDDATRVKRPLLDGRLAPRVVILDPELTTGTPDWLWTASGIRALDHAVESIYSKRHHPLSDALAAKAIRMLETHLAESVQPGRLTQIDDRSHCQMAAWLAVFGMTNAGFGLSHVLGHQIGPRWDVPHGVTSCIMLPHAMRFMARLAPHRFGPIAEAYDLPCDAQALVASALACADRTRDFIARLNQPSRLRDVGVPRHELDDIATAVHTALGEAAAVDRPVGREEIVRLLSDAY